MKPLKNNIFCGKHVPEDHRYNVEFYITKASVQCSLPMCPFYIWNIQTLLEILDIMLRGGKEGGNIGFAMVHASETSSTGRKASTFLQLLIKKGKV